MALGEKIARGVARGFRSGYTGVSGAEQDAQAAQSDMLSQRSELMKAELNDKLGIQDDKRRKAMATDLRKAGYFLTNGQPQEAIRLLENRKQFLKKDGKANSSQTDDFIKKIKAGDPTALDDLAIAENAFVLAGDIPAINDKQKQLLGMASQPEVKKFYETEGGGLVGVTSAGQSVNVELPEGVKIREKVNPFAQAIGALQLESAQLQKRKLAGEITDKEEKRVQDKITKKEGQYKELTQGADMVATMDSLLEGDSLESSAGWQSMFPTMAGSDVKTFEVQLETMKDQLFLKGVNQLKGMGALSEAEGRKIASAVGALDIAMGDKKLRSEITRIRNQIRNALAVTERKIKTGTFELPKGYTPVGTELTEQQKEIKRLKEKLKL